MSCGRKLASKESSRAKAAASAPCIYEHIVPTQKEAGLLALRAGVDLNITYEPAYMGPLVESVEEGRVPMALVDRALRRVLELKFRLGLFENPYVDVDHAVQVVHSQANQDSGSARGPRRNRVAEERQEPAAAQEGFEIGGGDRPQRG